MSNDRLVTRVIIIHELLPELQYLGTEEAEVQRTNELADFIFADIKKHRTDSVKIVHTTTVVSEK